MKRRLLLSICVGLLALGGITTSQGGMQARPAAPDILPPDPDLEPGFPVLAPSNGTGCYGAPGVSVLVGNIDADPDLEIIVPGRGTGLLHAVNPDGSFVPGWPLPASGSTGFAALGNLASSSSIDVFTSFCGGTMAARSGGGAPLPGWPRTPASYLFSPPALADIDRDGRDEIFLGEGDRRLHAYRADGTVLSGWPTAQQGYMERTTPAIADLDGDCRIEIISATGGFNTEYIIAYHDDGTVVAGFPVSGQLNRYTYPVVGDVDGDNAPEIVFVGFDNGSGLVRELRANGTIKRSWPIAGAIGNGSPPALADLDGDSIPEIIVQTDDALNVWKGDGTVFPGWPQMWGGYAQANGAPVVGDVDGDGQPDIAVAMALAGNCCSGEVRLYSRNGVLHSHFPKPLPLGLAGVPAIADIDNDGRNELIVMSTYLSSSQAADLVWAYDLQGQGPYGAIPWGQFMGGPRHQGNYNIPRPPCGITPTATITRTPPPTVPATPPTATQTVLATSTSGVPSPTGTPGAATPTPCPLQFSDVPPSQPFHVFIRCLACRGIVSGYADGTFRPGANVTRGQLSKILANAAGLTNAIPSTQQTFSDVPATQPFWLFIERLAGQGAISGYGCGGVGEPCDPLNRPYFRPANDATRGQIAKIDALAASIMDPIPTTRQTFADVPLNNPFWLWIEQLAGRGVINGYTCGGPGELCDPAQRPYFRWGANTTRGQMAKIAANTFFPGCVAPTR